MTIRREHDAALDALPSRELHDRAVRLAQERHDVTFFWHLLKAIPEAESVAGRPEESTADLLHLSRWIATSSTRAISTTRCGRSSSSTWSNTPADAGAIGSTRGNEHRRACPDHRRGGARPGRGQPPASRERPTRTPARAATRTTAMTSCGRSCASAAPASTTSASARSSASSSSPIRARSRRPRAACARPTRSRSSTCGPTPTGSPPRWRRPGSRTRWSSAAPRSTATAARSRRWSSGSSAARWARSSARSSRGRSTWRSRSRCR